jgi:hypothetical protein
MAQARNSGAEPEPGDAGLLEEALRGLPAVCVVIKEKPTEVSL